MALDWDSVGAEHVRQACALVTSGERPPAVTAEGLFVVYGESNLPAKHLLRLAYLLANRPLIANLSLQVVRGRSRDSLVWASLLCALRASG